MAYKRVPPAFLTVLISLLALVVYTRYGLLYSLYANAPNRLQRLNSLPNAKIAFPDIVRNCEDAILNANDRFILLSCDPGRDVWNTVMGTFDEPRTHPDTGIFIWHYANSITRPPIKIILLDFTARGTEFHPLGIEYHEPSRTLFVVNHAPSGSCIEVFKYLPAENAATHIKTILHPSIATPNSIQVLSETEILVTNDHYFRRRNNPTLAVLETYLAFRGGSITYVRWSPSAEDGVSEAEVLAHLPFANGIARLNSTTVAVSSSSMGAVYLYSIEQPEAGKSPRLKQIFTIPLSFLPDNLSVDTGGKLLIAGHPHAPSLEEVAKTNRFCQSDEAAEREKCAGARLSWVSEWSGEGGVKALFVGDEYGTSTTAVRDTKGGKGVGVVVGLYERGLYVWRE